MGTFIISTSGNSSTLSSLLMALNGALYPLFLYRCLPQGRRFEFFTNH
jgi:hypothetical protein